MREVRRTSSRARMRPGSASAPSASSVAGRMTDTVTVSPAAAGPASCARVPQPVTTSVANAAATTTAAAVKRATTPARAAARRFAMMRGARTRGPGAE